jgi:hypothetical protein
MREYEIWHGGYVSFNGKSTSDPYLIGTAHGESFIDACKAFRYSEATKEGGIVHAKGEPLRLDYHQGGVLRLTEGQPGTQLIPLFDNEADARRSFEARKAERSKVKTKRRR